MKRMKGFTLIELLVVVAIISVLIALLLPALSKARGAAQSAVCLSNFHSTGMGIQQYANDNNDMMYKSYTAGNPWPAWWPQALALNNYMPMPQTFQNRNESNRDVWNCPIVKANGLSRGAVVVAWTCLRMANWYVWSGNWGTADWIKMSRIENPSKQIFLIDGSMTDVNDILRGFCGSMNAAYTRNSYNREIPYTLDNVGTSAPGFVHNGMATILFSDMHVEMLAPNEITRNMCEDPDK